MVETQLNLVSIDLHCLVNISRGPEVSMIKRVPHELEVFSFHLLYVPDLNDPLGVDRSIKTESCRYPVVVISTEISVGDGVSLDVLRRVGVQVIKTGLGVALMSRGVSNQLNIAT